MVSAMCVAGLLAAAAAAAAGPSRVWHFTDIHVDPIYLVGSDVFAYCNGPATPGSNNKAGKFGNSSQCTLNFLWWGRGYVRQARL